MLFRSVNLAWVFFRAPNVSSALALLRAAFTLKGGSMTELLCAGVFDSEVTALSALFPALPVGPIVLFALLGIGLLCALWPKNALECMERLTPSAATLASCTLLALWAISSFSAVSGFIYSNF